MLATNMILASLLTQLRQCAPNEISIAGQCYRLQRYYDECDFTQVY